MPAYVERVYRSDLAALSAPGLCGFRLRYIMREGEVPGQFSIRLRTTTEQVTIENPGLDLFNRSNQAWHETEHAFFSRLRPGASILELGARARSGITRRGLFKDLCYTGLDIKVGENVDLVGDAHRLTSLFKPGQFDCAYSISVFEHLLCPWKMALELNTVLKTGGVVLTQSHQTWPKHEEPWDFFRFCASGWASLFCKATGFRIIKAADDMLGYVVQAHYITWGLPTWRSVRNLAFSYRSALPKRCPTLSSGWDADPDYSNLGNYPA